MATSTTASCSAPSTPDEDRCAWCSKLCRPRRCTRCYSVSFCSRECQRADWHDENGHRKTCDALYSTRTGSTTSDSAGPGAAAASTAAVAASNNVRNFPAPDVVATTEAELRELLSGKLANMSLSQVQEEYYKTMDVIKDMEASMSKTESSPETPPTPTPMPTPIEKEEFSVKKEFSKSKMDTLIRPARPIQSKGVAAAPSIFDSVGEDWQCLVERLPHVSCYSITLTLRARERNLQRRLNAKQNEITPLADRLRMKIAQAKNSKSKTSVTVFEVGCANGTNEQEKIVALTLPGAILPDAPGVRLSVDDTDGSISIRLPYGDAQRSNWACVDDGDEIVAAAASPLSDPGDLTVISCGSCGHNLLANDAVISKVLPLPIGCWDEISDYLTCYEGVSFVLSTKAAFLTFIYLTLSLSPYIYFSFR